MELMGNSLEYLFRKCNKQFSLKTILLLAFQMVECLQQLHAVHYIHRDIKPENFVMGLGDKSSTVFLLDFGLSKLYKEPITGLHIPYKENKSFTGTPRYASLNTHLGIEQSRRDDLESLGYIFAYFLNGSLPWQNIPAANKLEKYEKIKKVKETYPIEKLCKALPIEFAIYLNYCVKMKYNQRPDYIFILSIFKDLFYKKGYKLTDRYDWEQTKQDEEEVYISLQI